MSETANQAVYKQELIKTFEQRQSLLEPRVTTEGIASGATFTFLVNGSGGAGAVTRSMNGLIPSRANDDTQVTATMTEWHDKPSATAFNFFAGQAGARRRAAMQEESVGVLNRKADDLLITALGTSTQYAGLSASTLTVDKAMHAVAVVLRGNVDLTANDVTGLLTPAALAYLMQAKEVTSKDYVEMGPLPNMPLMIRWAGITWITHNRLSGVGTSSERLVVFHRRAIGLARGDAADMNVAAGYNEEHQYYYARCSRFMGAALLQNTGVCSIRHDGSAYEPTA